MHRTIIKEERIGLKGKYYIIENKNRMQIIFTGKICVREVPYNVFRPLPIHSKFKIIMYTFHYYIKCYHLPDNTNIRYIIALNSLRCYHLFNLLGSVGTVWLNDIKSGKIYFVLLNTMKFTDLHLNL